MAALRKTLWTIAAITALPAAAEATDICGAIARIAAAARERPAFGSINRALTAGEAVVPGFEAGECQVTARGVDCRETMHRGAFRNWPDLATCPGVVAFEPPPPPVPQLRWPSNRSYRLGRLQIGRGVSCPGCAALGPSYFSMGFERPRGRQP